MVQSTAALSSRMHASRSITSALRTSPRARSLRTLARMASPDDASLAIACSRACVAEWRRLMISPNRTSDVRAKFSADDVAAARHVRFRWDASLTRAVACSPRASTGRQPDHGADTPHARPV